MERYDSHVAAYANEEIQRLALAQLKIATALLPHHEALLLLTIAYRSFAETTADRLCRMVGISGIGVN